MIKTTTKHFNIKICVLLLSALFCLSCQSSDDETLFNNDATAKQTIERASKLLSSGQKLTSEDFEKVKALYEKYPTSKTLRQTYQSALIRRDDWGTLEKFLTENNSSTATNDDKKTLAKVYVKLGKFQKALELLKPLIAANPDDKEIRGLAGLSYFNTGEMEEAGKQFDSIWDDLVKNESYEEIATRGIIYFRQNDLPKAIEALEKSLEIKPDHIPSNNTLSRIYAQQGDLEKAESYGQKTATAQKNLKQQTFTMGKKVEDTVELKKAWEQKNYQKVISLAKKLLSTTTDKNQKNILYQYLYKSYQALGMKTEAQNTLKQAQNLK
jgi:tetratricopeptide (TPR) repeat protein